MALILWSNDYSVGVPRLDADHIVIASLINHIDDAKQTGADESVVAGILRVLLDFAATHFRREEAMMQKAGFAGLADHVREHELLAEQLDELHDEYAASRDPEISREIMELLNFWLVEHILTVDMRYRSQLAPEAES